MGHMAQQRQLTSHTPQDKQYDTHSLGRTTPGAVVATHNTQSLTTLSEIGRSRSDLGYTTARQDINQSHRSSHTAQPSHHKPPTTHPRKPPRIIHYQQAPLSSGKSVKPKSVPITSVENTEYYTLTDSPSSDYNSDQSAELSYDSSPPAKHSLDFTISHGRHNLPYPITTPSKHRAIVLCEYRRKGISEISLSKNTVVNVLEGSHNTEWWKVETESGIQGFYPANFLRHIQ